MELFEEFFWESILYFHWEQLRSHLLWQPETAQWNKGRVSSTTNKFNQGYEHTLGHNSKNWPGLWIRILGITLLLIWWNQTKLIKDKLNRIFFNFLIWMVSKAFISYWAWALKFQPYELYSLQNV